MHFHRAVLDAFQELSAAGYTEQDEVDPDYAHLTRKGEGLARRLGRVPVSQTFPSAKEN